MASTKNKKILFGPMLLVIALLVAGYAYADWTQTIFIEGDVETGIFCFEFVAASYFDHESLTPENYDMTCDPYTMDNVGLIVPNKDVAYTTGILSDEDVDGCLDTLTVTVHNAFPCYYNEISVKVHNCGTIPLVIQDATVEWEGTEYTLPVGRVFVLDISGDDILELRWLNSVGDQLDESDQREVSFELHVLQEAEPDSTYEFTIKITAIQWNKYP